MNSRQASLWWWCISCRNAGDRSFFHCLQWLTWQKQLFHSWIQFLVDWKKCLNRIQYIRKSTFSDVYTPILWGFLPTIYQFGIVCALAYRCFKVCSVWTKFNKKLNFMKQAFLKYGYPLPFIDNCFKTFVDKFFIKHPHITTIEKKTLFLSLAYLGEISLKTRTKIRKFLKGILNCCKLQIIFKSQKNFWDVFRFKDRLSFDLMSE